MERKGYPSDLTDAQWEAIKDLIPPAKPGGRPRTTDLRQVLNAINYLLRTGCQWAFLPRDFPPKSTVYDYFWEWGQADVWEQIHDILRREIRGEAGREESPSAAVIDSQTAKTTEKGAARLRRRQENHRPQAPHHRRHPGADPRVGGPAGQPLG